ncbi:signal recognition particle receptor subunit alpha, partial [Vagococcus fluvialis]
MGFFDKIKKAVLGEKPAEEEIKDLPVEQEETPEIEEVTSIETVEVETPVEEKAVEIKEEIQVEKEEVVKQEETIEKYDKGLEKSRKTFGQFMNDLFSNFRMVDDEFFEELEEALISADVGFETAMRISDELQEEVKLKNVKK